MNRWLIALVLASAVPAAGAPKTTTADLSWLAGHWRADVWGGRGEEFWSKPEAGVIMAAFRYMKDGKLVLSEFMTIEDDAQHGPLLRIKHFGPGMKAREEKDESATFHIVRSGPREASFVQEKDGRRVTLTYRRTGPESLEAVLIRDQGGKRDETAFRYSRVAE
jgi:hypothetical protein